MTAVEEMQAAIEKLTELKNEPIVTALFTATAADAAWFSRTSKKLAIFHRTIDAQLRTLQGGITFTRRHPDLHDMDILDLARAINGVTA